MVICAVLLAAVFSNAMASSTIKVQLVNIEFRPAQVRLEPGDRIEFTNLDPFEHTVLLANAANPNLVIVPDRKLQPNETYTTEPLEAEGVFTLYCSLHGGMKAQVSTTGSFEVTEEMRQAVAGALPPEVKAGEEVFWGRGQCHQCHTIGDRGTADYGPNLEDIGLRARSRAADRGLDTASDYLVESVLRPDAYIVPGYANDMARVFHPPIDLDQSDLVQVITYLQSQGGMVDVWEINITESDLELPPPPGLPVIERDAEAGKEIFFGDLSCGSCHRVAELGGGVGPELTQIGAYRDEAFFLLEILHPSAVVPTGYRPIGLFLKNFETVSGVLRKETPEAYVVKLSDESVRTIAKEEVDQVQIAADSNMPAFNDIMTLQQLADLLAYLETLR